MTSPKSTPQARPSPGGTAVVDLVVDGDGTATATATNQRHSLVGMATTFTHLHLHAAVQTQRIPVWAMRERRRAGTWLLAYTRER